MARRRNRIAKRQILAVVGSGRKRGRPRKDSKLVGRLVDATENDPETTSHGAGRSENGISDGDEEDIGDCIVVDTGIPENLWVGGIVFGSVWGEREKESGDEGRIRRKGTKRAVEVEQVLEDPPSIQESELDLRSGSKELMDEDVDLLRRESWSLSEGVLEQTRKDSRDSKIRRDSPDEERHNSKTESLHLASAGDAPAWIAKEQTSPPVTRNSSVNEGHHATFDDLYLNSAEDTMEDVVHNDTTSATTDDVLDETSAGIRRSEEIMENVQQADKSTSIEDNNFQNAIEIKSEYVGYEGSTRIKTEELLGDHGIADETHEGSRGSTEQVQEAAGPDQAAISVKASHETSTMINTASPENPQPLLIANPVSSFRNREISTKSFREKTDKANSITERSPNSVSSRIILPEPVSIYGNAGLISISETIGHIDEHHFGSAFPYTPRATPALAPKEPDRLALSSMENQVVVPTSPDDRRTPPLSTNTLSDEPGSFGSTGTPRDDGSHSGRTSLPEQNISRFNTGEAIQEARAPSSGLQTANNQGVVGVSTLAVAPLLHYHNISPPDSLQWVKDLLLESPGSVSWSLQNDAHLNVLRSVTLLPHTDQGEISSNSCVESANPRKRKRRRLHGLSHDSVDETTTPSENESNPSRAPSAEQSYPPSRKASTWPAHVQNGSMVASLTNKGNNDDFHPTPGWNAINVRPASIPAVSRLVPNAQSRGATSSPPRVSLAETVSKSYVSLRPSVLPSIESGPQPHTPPRLESASHKQPHIVRDWTRYIPGRDDTGVKVALNTETNTTSQHDTHLAQSSGLIIPDENLPKNGIVATTTTATNQPVGTSDIKTYRPISATDPAPKTAENSVVHPSSNTSSNTLSTMLLDFAHGPANSSGPVTQPVFASNIRSNQFGSTPWLGRTANKTAAISSASGRPSPTTKPILKNDSTNASISTTSKGDLNSNTSNRVSTIPELTQPTSYRTQGYSFSNKILAPAATRHRDDTKSRDEKEERSSSVSSSYDPKQSTAYSVPRPYVFQGSSQTSLKPVYGYTSRDKGSVDDSGSSSRTSENYRSLRDWANYKIANRSNVELEAEETVGGPKRCHPDVHGVFIDRRSGSGIVVLTASGVPIHQVDTGQMTGEPYAELVIQKGQACVTYGNPTVLFYKGRKVQFQGRNDTVLLQPQQERPRIPSIGQILNSLPPPTNTRTPLPSSIPTSDPQITIRLQIDSDGRFSTPYNFSIIEKHIRSCDFFAWYDKRINLPPESHTKSLHFTLQNAVPQPKSVTVWRDVDSDYQHVKDFILARYERAISLLPGLREFSVLITRPGWGEALSFSE